MGMIIFILLLTPIYGAVCVLFFNLSMVYIGICKFEGIFNYFNLVNQLHNYNYNEKKKWITENKIWCITSPSSDNICFFSRKSAMAFKLRFD